MSSTQLDTLRMAWKSLGFTEHEVAQAARMPVSRLRAIDRNLQEILTEEADVLSALLGISIDDLLDGPVATRPLASLLKGEATSLDASTRFSLAEATFVAREVQGLRARLGLQVGLGPVGEFHANADYQHPREGVHLKLAHVVRARVERPTGPLEVQSDLLDRLGIIVLWLPMPAQIDAVAMASEETGAVIIANPQGTHMRSATGRRMAMAHEICHILFDRPEMARFARACVMELPDTPSGQTRRWSGPRGKQASWFESVERRARAFAAALLAPPDDVRAIWADGAALKHSARIVKIADHFGISYTATRAHLHNLQLLDMDTPVPADRWGATREMRDLTPPAPPPGVPMIRSGVLLQLADEAVHRGLVSRRWAEEVVQGPFRADRPWTPSGPQVELAGHVSSLDAHAGAS
jgi:Zn-dependent peptidase ImmA (M78 family)